MTKSNKIFNVIDYTEREKNSYENDSAPIDNFGAYVDPLSVLSPARMIDTTPTYKVGCQGIRDLTILDCTSDFDNRLNG